METQMKNYESLIEEVIKLYPGQLDLTGTNFDNDGNASTI
jgi:hypothetical protein